MGECGSAKVELNHADLCSSPSLYLSSSLFSLDEPLKVRLRENVYSLSRSILCSIFCKYFLYKREEEDGEMEN